MGREVGGEIPGVGLVLLEKAKDGGFVDGRLLVQGGGGALHFEVGPKGADGRRTLRGAAWLEEPLAGGVVGWFGSRAGSDGWHGGWRLPGSAGEEVGFDLVPGSRIRERRCRSGLSLLGWGASLRLMGRWPEPASSATWSRDAHAVIREAVSDWLDETRRGWVPDWRQGLRERSVADEWEGTLQVRTIWHDEVVASFHGTEYLYTGGAHGHHANVAWNFLRNGDGVVPLELGDFFREASGWPELLTSEARSRLVDAGASWPAEGATVDSGRAFTVCPAGLWLYYDPYEVGSYAEGTYVVWIPWDRLEAVRRPGPWHPGGTHP